MNKKNLIVLCAIFVILIGLVVAKKKMKSQVPTKEEMVAIIVSPVNIDDFVEIVLRLGDGTEEDKERPQSVHLAKENGQWVVKTQYGVRANEKIITSILDKLDQLKGEIRSNREGILRDYGIEDDQGIHVELRREGAEDTHIIIGTQKAGYKNNFVRLAGTNAVYIVGENLIGAFGVRGKDEEQKLDTEKWSDKHIVDLKVDDVVGIAIMQMINGVEETIIDIRKKLVNDRKQWQSVKPYPFGLSASKIKSLLEAFNNTYAREIVSAENPEVFDALGWTGTFTLGNGDQVKLVRGAKDVEEKNYYAKIEGAEYFYLVPVSTFDSREKKQGNILSTNPLEVEEGNVEEIDVRDIDSKKKFRAVKKSALKSDEIEIGDEAEDQEVQQEDSWQTPGGEAVETAKVYDIIGKIKNMNLEVVSQAVSFPKEALILKIKIDGETKEYTIGNNIKLDNGKECHFLKLKGEDQSYCVSKAHITALKNALP